jgi:hypothetical protein
MASNIRDRRVFYRNRINNFLVWVITMFGALYFLVELIHSINETEYSFILIGLTGILMIAFLIPALRCPRSGVVVTSGSVMVRNILKTHVLRWDEVERFELTRYDPWPKVGVAILKSGRRIPMTGVQFALATRFAQNTVAALNAQLVEMRGQGAQGGPADGYPSAQSI